MCTLTVSIIVTNYNYARFLGDALDSARAQTRAPLEIIVVDDGSTDDSPRVIQEYADQIRALYKSNGGQASAFNAGFAASVGEIVIFLDADDVLLPDTLERVTRAFAQNPNAVKVQWRVELMSAEGAPINKTIPPAYCRLPNGDLRRRVLTFPDDVPYPPTSGHAFRRALLEKILPMPEGAYRVCADYYLSNLPPLYGQVVWLDGIGARYRVHGANHDYSPALNLERTRQIITRSIETHRQIQRVARENNLPFPADPTAIPSVTFLAHRLVSLKLEPMQHPLKTDRVAALARAGARAAWGRFDLPLAQRVVYAAWFLSMAAAPTFFCAKTTQYITICRAAHRIEFDG